MRTTFKHLSKRARQLLGGSEGTDVEFKQDISAVSPSLISAFANSPGGGAILVGVREQTGERGTQEGEILGSPVGDDQRLQIVNKALSCVPPVEVLVIVENTKRTPFLRIEIPESDDAPHSTGGGTYKIREDGRNRALHPEQLLSIYLDREARTFRERFERAAKGITATLDETSGLVEDIEHTVESGLSEIESELGWAVYHAQDAESELSKVAYNIQTALNRLEEVNERMASLLQYHGTPDPVKERARKKLLEYLIDKFRSEPDTLRAVAKGEALKLSGPPARLLSSDELGGVLTEAVETVLEGLEEQTPEEEDERSSDSGTESEE